MPAGFISEWWPASNRNGGRLHVGKPGRNKSESARDAAELVEKAAPCVLAGVEDCGVGFEHAIGEIGLAQVLPDVFRRIQFRASGRQRNQGEIFRELELARGVPGRLVENDQRVRAGCNSQADLVDMLLHGFGVGMRHDDCYSNIAARTDCAEKISIFVTLVLWLARSRALFGPLVDQTVLLSNTHLILEPDLDRRCRRKCIHNLCDQSGEVFLKAAIACGSCAGCCGRALICEKPSFLSTRPIATVDRSTPKRCPRTRCRSAHRQRTTPSFSGSGPVSTSSRNTSRCSADNFGRRPVGLTLIRPSGPVSLKRWAQSRSVWRSMPPIRAAVARSIPS